MKHCCINHCESPILARGYCRMHYLRWYKHGDPLHVADRIEYTKRGADLPQTKHGLWKHPLYATWYNMVQRCQNPANPKFKRYGGRGIEVCQEWQDVARFIADMSPRPKNSSLDRIDNDGPYSRSNCRWASLLVQARNRPQATLTNEQRSEAIRLYSLNGSPKRTAASLGLTSSAVKNVVYGEKKRLNGRS